MPGVNSVQPRVQGGLLDTILKGVAVARDIYGIKHDMAATDAAEQKAAQDQQRFQDEQAGVVDPKSYLEWGRNYQKAADPEDPNGVDVAHRVDGNVVTERMIPRQKTPLVAHVSVPDSMMNGKHGTAVYDANKMDGTPTGGLLSFIETEKQRPDPKDHFTFIPDREGNLVKGNTLTGSVEEVDAGGAKFGKGVDPDEKAAKDLDKAEKVYTELGTKIETPRGNKAVSQASVNLMSADNALALANKYKGNYDKMPPGDYALFVGELSKISTGGIGSEHSQSAIAANTLASKWAAFKQSIGGDPTPAQLGGFIANNVGYLNELRNVSNNVVMNYKHQIWNSYKNRLPQELQDRFKAEHGDMFPNEQPAAPAAQQQGALVGSAHGVPEGTAIAGGGEAKPSAAFDPEADKARKFVQDNINSPNPTIRQKAAHIQQLLQESDKPDIPVPGGKRL